MCSAEPSRQNRLSPYRWVKTVMIAINAMPMNSCERVKRGMCHRIPCFRVSHCTLDRGRPRLAHCDEVSDETDRIAALGPITQSP